MTTKGLHRLSDTLSVAANDNGIILYDTRAHTPKLVTTLDVLEMNGLVTLWEDGYCAVCMCAIPQHHYLCHDCTMEAWEQWK